MYICACMHMHLIFIVCAACLFKNWHVQSLHECSPMHVMQHTCLFVHSCLCSYSVHVIPWLQPIISDLERLLPTNLWPYGLSFDFLLSLLSALTWHRPPEHLMPPLYHLVLFTFVPLSFSLPLSLLCVAHAHRICIPFRWCHVCHSLWENRPGFSFSCSWKFELGWLKLFRWQCMKQRNNWRHC